MPGGSQPVARDDSSTDVVEAASRRLWTWPLAAFVGVVASAWFFRGFFQSGFRITQGDDIDGRVITLQVIHWWKPFAFGNPLDVGIFFPAPATLGTTDALLLFGIGSWPLSLIFDSPQVAVQVFLILLSLAGYALWLYFFRGQIQAPWVLSITGAVLLIFGNPIYVMSGNFKMLTLWLAPLPIVLITTSLRATRRRVRIASAIGAGVAVGLIALTSFVVVWFLFMAVMTVAVIWAALGLFARTISTHTLARLGQSLLPALVGLVLTLPPLLLIYLPNLDGSGTATTATGFALALRLTELINVSDTNLVWGPLIGELPEGLMRSDISTTLREWQLAPTPLVLLFAAISLVVGIWTIRRTSLVQVLGLASIAAGFVFWVVPVRDFLPLPTGGTLFFFPWLWIQDLPGADGIRYISRFEIFAFMMLVFGLVLLIGEYLNRQVQRGQSQPLVRGILAIALVLVVLEQVNLQPTQETDRGRWDALSRIDSPPAECATFAIVDEFPDTDHTWETMNDARALAWINEVPSINGFSSLEPTGWKVDNVSESTYTQRLTDWVQANDLENVCLLSLREGTWDFL